MRTNEHAPEAGATTEFRPFILGIGGTSRPGSSSERALRVALDAAASLGCDTQLLGGDFITALPIYDVEHTQRTREERLLVEAVLRCDGIIVSSPGYHGTVSGPIKNALDLVEETAKAERVYLEGRAFGAIVSAYGWQACGTTLVTLRSVAHALRAWPTPFGATINATTPLFDADGACLDAAIEAQLRLVATQVVDFCRWRHSGLAAR